MVEIQEKSKVHILVVRIHLDRDFSDIPTSSELYNLMKYFSCEKYEIIFTDYEI